ncbi:hypothetical protein [Thermomonospora umbrina]|uniref:Uncharacterized protein n=1 Tax=Thermomonospora umbrina TaxID=111806 RepID=A0A3D9STY4_9ACTN|nr:hypothetical protein [Thermomonospora umbrina]REE97483.1 hypothetical protein DFJ69_2956 [Thermomonospora umbrina]
MALVISPMAGGAWADPADEPEITTRVSVGLSPAPRVQGQRVNAVGLLQKHDPDSDTWSALPGGKVTLWFKGTHRRALVGYARSGRDGWFSIPFSAPAQGELQATFAGDETNGHRPATDSSPWYQPGHAARIKGFRAAGKKAGTRVALTIRGRLVRLSDTGERSMVEANPILMHSFDGKKWTPATTVGLPTTRIDGTFTLQGTVPARGFWRLVGPFTSSPKRVSPTSTTYRDEGSTWTSVVPTRPLPGTNDPSPTRVSVHVTPAIDTYSRTSTVSGRLQVVNARGLWENLGGRRLGVYRINPYNGRVITSLEATTDAEGRYRIQAPIEDVGGTWAARYVPAADDRHAPVNSVVEHLTYKTKYPTRITSFDAGPEPVRRGAQLTVSGCLEKYETTQWQPAYRDSGVQIQFRPSGSKVWRIVARTKLLSGCGFRASIRASQDGTWRVHYAGGARHHPATTPGDYVDVR